MNAPLEDRLRTELREDAADVGLRAGFVASTVASVLARRRRRQYGVVATAVAVAAVLTLGGVAVGAQSGDGATPPVVDDPTPTVDLPVEPLPSAPELDLADVQEVSPEQMDWDSLPWRDTALPRVMPTDVASAPALADDPIDYALALVAGPEATVGVIGEDGQLRRLDGVALEQTRDPAGYRSRPVTQGSLTRDGTLAAFPQPGAVVVVDLASGSSERYNVPGLNTRVVWHPDKRQIVVGRESGPSSILDTAEGTVDDAPYNAYRTAFTEDGAALDIRPTAAKPWPYDLVRWDDAETDRQPLSIWPAGENPPRVTDGRLVVAGGVDDINPSESTSEPGLGWIVLDADTGEPTAMLRMPEPWYGTWMFGQCGWLDDDTVLVQSEPGLLAWTPSTGALERVTEGSGYDMSLATGVLD